MKPAHPAAAALVALALQAGMFPTASRAADASSDATVVRTDSGLVRGVHEQGVVSFKAIPYAASPAGDLRWALPQPPTPWTGVRDATAYGSGCPQVARYGLTEAGYDEDCLSINVTVPDSAPASPGAKRPVIAWIYGGAFVGGSSALYPLAHMAISGNAIVASFNYRLGVFGFMANPAFGRDHDGTYGLEDQRAALRWVQRNIAAFGGDPANVTVAGESAGAASVCMHLVAPNETTGLFAKAVIQSAVCVQHLRTREEADAVGARVSQLVGCDKAAALRCLRGTPVKELLEAAAKVAGSDIMAYAPSVGTTALGEQPRDALAAGRFVHVPILNGGNREELRLYVAYAQQAGDKVTAANYASLLRGIYGDNAGRVLAGYPLAGFSSAPSALGTVMSDYRPDNGLNNCGYLETARLASAHVPVFEYEFADPDPPPVTADPAFEMGAVHSAELPYQFPHFSNTTKLDGPDLAPASQRLASVMMQYWTSFAATGSPRAQGAPEWARFGSPTQVMRLKPGQVGYFDAAAEHQCGLWQQLYPDRLHSSEKVETRIGAAAIP